MEKSSVLIFCLFFIGAYCASVGTFVRSGERASPGQFPFLALIQQRDPNNTGVFEYSAGTLISDQYVLTSWFSLAFLEDDFAVILGADDWKSPPGPLIKRFFNLKFQDLIRPEPFRPTIDAALVKLPEKVIFNERIQPVALPRWSDVGRDYADAVATIAGWGPTEAEGKTTEEPEQFISFTQITVEAPQNCDVSPEAICAVEKRTAIHEEGVPLLLNEDRVLRQIGVRVGFGYIGGNPGRVIDLYSKTAGYLEWIASNSNAKIDP